MAFCMHCGTRLEDGQPFCTKCGARRVVSTQPPAASIVAPVPPTPPSAPTSASAAAAQAQRTEGTPAVVKGHGGLKVILIVVGLLVCLGVTVAGVITYAVYRITTGTPADGSGAPASAVRPGRIITKQEASAEAADTIPSGWKVSRDPTGSFEVATPPDWQMGRDFFLQREKTEARKIGDMSVQAPPSGLAMWGIEGREREKMSQLPEGKRFQIRCSLVRGEAVCSVWRIKGPDDFTAEEKNTMKQVGKTLRWVE